jgi:Class III cytochrome C family
MAASTYRRVAVVLALAGCLLISPPAVSGGMVWDIGIACGYVCVALVLCLYMFPLRGDGLPHGRLLGLSQHRVLGWWSLVAAILHVGILIGSQTSVGRYLLPSAPVFIWCGLVALVLAAVLIQTGLAARSAMRRSTSPGHPPRYATLHIVLAGVIVLTLCAHIIGSAQAITGLSKTTAVILLLGLPLVWFALRPRTGCSHQTLARRVTHVSVAAVLPLLPLPNTNRLLLEPATRPDSIAVNFPHESHTSVNCVACHHNYVDHTGVLACIDCHRSQRTDLPRSSEATFHTFCRDCHTRMALDGAKHGPTRTCSRCHRGIRSRSF